MNKTYKNMDESQNNDKKKMCCYTAFIFYKTLENANSSVVTKSRSVTDDGGMYNKPDRIIVTLLDEI